MALTATTTAAAIGYLWLPYLCIAFFFGLPVHAHQGAGTQPRQGRITDLLLNPRLSGPVGRIRSSAMRSCCRPSAVPAEDPSPNKDGPASARV